MYTYVRGEPNVEEVHVGLVIVTKMLSTFPNDLLMYLVEFIVSHKRKEANS